MFGVDDPVPVVVFCELPVVVLVLVLVPVLDEVEPSEVVEPGCVVEPEALGDCAVAGVVDVDDGRVEVPVEDELPVGALTLVPAPVPLGVAPPPLIIVDTPPVCWDFSLVGTVTVVVAVVTVVGVARGAPPAAGAIGTIRVGGLGAGVAAWGAASSDGSALAYVTGVADRGAA
jgi:hypothetical protein